MWWVETRMPGMEFHCPLGTHRSLCCPFRGEVWIELVFKPQTNGREDPWQRLMVSCLILPGGSCVTTQLCFYQRWLDHAWRNCLPNLLRSKLPGMWNPTAKPATCQSITKQRCVQYCLHVVTGSDAREARLGPRFPKGVLKRNIAGYSCDVAFLGPPEHTSEQERKEDGSIPSPAYSRLLFAIGQHPSSGELALLHTRHCVWLLWATSDTGETGGEPEAQALLLEEQL